MEGHSGRRGHAFSSAEWLLIGMILFGIALVALRWDYIRHEVNESVKRYIERGEWRKNDCGEED